MLEQLTIKWPNAILCYVNIRFFYSSRMFPKHIFNAPKIWKRKYLSKRWQIFNNQKQATSTITNPLYVPAKSRDYLDCTLRLHISPGLKMAFCTIGKTVFYELETQKVIEISAYELTALSMQKTRYTVKYAQKKTKLIFMTKMNFRKHGYCR